MCEGWWTESQKRWWEKWDASTRNEATQISWRHSSGASVDRIRIIGARFLFSSGIWRHPRISRQTQSSMACTNVKMGSRYLAGKNRKKNLSSFSSWMQWHWQLSLDLCQRLQPQTGATDNVISWNLGPPSIHATTLRRTGHAKESSNYNAAGDLDFPRKQV